MLIALSANYSELDAFEWYSYISPKGTSLVSPKERVILRSGDVFGIKEIRGGRFKVVLAEAYKQNFMLEENEGLRLINKSKARRKPIIKELEIAKRTFNADTHKQAASFRSWDSDYFKAARVVTSEAKQGVDFSNYQWRKLHPNASMKIEKNATKFIKVPMGSIFGVRFLVPVKGGIFIDRDGKRMSLSPKAWKEMLEKSTVLPKNKWPEGSFTVEQMKDAMEQDVEIRKQQSREEKRIQKEIEIGKKREAEEIAKRKRLADTLKKKEENDRLADKRIKNKLAEAKKKKEFVPREVDTEAVEDYLKNLKVKEQKDILEDVELDFDDDDSLDDDLDLTPTEEKDLNDLDSILDIPEDAELSDDSIDPIELLDNAIKDKRKSSPINLKDFGDDEEEPEEDDEDVAYEDEDDDYDDEEDSEEEETDPDEEYEDAEADEDEAESELDEDEVAAVDEELEEPEEGDDAEYRADEGDVVNFESDSKDNRDFVILSIYPFSKNNSIMIYKVYDMTTEPDGYHTVRINTLQKRKFEDMVKFQRKLEPKEFQELLDLTDTYERLNDSIVS